MCSVSKRFQTASIRVSSCFSCFQTASRRLPNGFQTASRQVSLFFMLPDGFQTGVLVFVRRLPDSFQTASRRLIPDRCPYNLTALWFFMRPDGFHTVSRQVSLCIMLPDGFQTGFLVFLCFQTASRQLPDGFQAGFLVFFMLSDGFQTADVSEMFRGWFGHVLGCFRTGMCPTIFPEV